MGSNFGRMKLEGAKAADALNCMVDANVIDRSTAALQTPQVDLFETGSVWVSENASGSSSLIAAYAAKENVEAAVPLVETPTRSETGKVAEGLTAKARACAYKAAGLIS